MQDVEAGSLPCLSHDSHECEANLGDVILGMSVISEQCVCDGVSLEHRLPVIVTHGLTHILGYTHNSLQLAQTVSIRSGMNTCTYIHPHMSGLQETAHHSPLTHDVISLTGDVISLTDDVIFSLMMSFLSLMMSFISTDVQEGNCSTDIIQ